MSKNNGLQSVRESRLDNTCVFTFPKIVNGSKLSIGGKNSRYQLNVDQHFNWFQKLMWKLCFGVKVENYSEN